jgi:hypothetical protein
MDEIAPVMVGEKAVADPSAAVVTETLKRSTFIDVTR